MGMGSATLDIKDSGAGGETDPVLEKARLEKKYFGNTEAPPKVPTFDPTDAKLAAVRAATALDLRTGSRKASFSSSAGGDKALAERQALLALQSKKGA